MRGPVVGQSWTYRQLNRFNGTLVQTVRETVASAQGRIVLSRETQDGQTLPQEIHQTWGQLWRDPVWDAPMNLVQPLPLWPSQLQPMRPLSIHSRYRLDGASFQYWVNLYLVVHGWERVTLGNRTFDALHIERMLRLDHPDPGRVNTQRQDRMWLVPEIGRWVARETSGRYLMNDGDQANIELLEDHFRWELVSWQ